MTEPQAHPAQRDTKPGGATQSGKGAAVMGPALSPTGPNEVDLDGGSARIAPRRPVPPGENGLVGGVGFEGSGNVEPEPLPPEAKTYPSMRDEEKSAEDRASEREEIAKKREEANAKLAEDTGEDAVDEAKEQGEKLKAASEEAGEEQRKARVEAVEAEGKPKKAAAKK